MSEPDLTAGALARQHTIDGPHYDTFGHNPSLCLWQVPHCGPCWTPGRMKVVTPSIPDLDAWLREITDGLPRDPGQRLEFRCHPDVYLAIREAADLNYREPVSAEGSPAFGSADVNVKPELGSGRWELYQNGQRVKSGSLDPDKPS